MIKDLMEQKNITAYRLSKSSGVPYSTLTDILKGKTNLEKCSAETVYKLAKALDVTMEELIEPCMEKPISFELFKSNVCHQVKYMGDIDFMLYVLENGVIWEYYNKKMYPESLYMLGMLDYLSRVNGIPQCTEYDDLRKKRFLDPIYPMSILVKADALGDENILKETYEDSIPEFRNFNIIEGDIRNVI